MPASTLPPTSSTRPPSNWKPRGQASLPQIPRKLCGRRSQDLVMGKRRTSRRHDLGSPIPLTLQGEEIGHFEISFGCGDKDHYKAAYSETRRIAEEKPVRLVGLAIATAGKQVATFNVVSSLRDMREANMSSIASGTVSPAFMGELTRNGGQSLAVATIDSNKVKTVIIIGPVGLSAGSKQFLAKCNIPSPDDGPAPHRVMGPR